MNLSDCRQLEQDVWTYEEEDVKNFIRELKEKLIGFKTQKIQGEIINELAGDALVSQSEVENEKWISKTNRERPKEVK